MLHTIKRWFSTGTGAGSEWGGAEGWAEARRLSFKRTREGDGFVVESPSTGWRVEWGPSQRPYIAGHELRLRGETGEADLQMMVLSRSLMDAMERAVFEQFTEELQTRIDTATPEEMRWLVLFPKLPDSELKVLRDSFGAAGSALRFVGQWLEGPLSLQLQQARSSWLAPEDPLALVLHRGRLTMRLAVEQPDAAILSAALALFEVALREGRRATQAFGESGVASTQPVAWGVVPPQR
jgi:hypothetical protein